MKKFITTMLIFTILLNISIIADTLETSKNEEITDEESNVVLIVYNKNMLYIDGSNYIDANYITIELDKLGYDLNYSETGWFITNSKYEVVVSNIGSAMIADCSSKFIDYYVDFDVIDFLLLY